MHLRRSSTRCGTVDTTADDVQAATRTQREWHCVPFHCHYPSLGRHDQSLRGSTGAWSRYLKVLTLREKCIFQPQCLNLPDYWCEGLDTSAPFVRNRQLWGPVIGEEAYAAGEVAARVGQAIIQHLLWLKQEWNLSRQTPSTDLRVMHKPHYHRAQRLLLDFGI